MLRSRLTVLALTLILLSAAATLAAAPPAASPDVTVTGEIVDLACYIGMGGKGAMHKPCAAKCAAMGQPVGVLAADGKLYLLVADHIDSSAYEKARKLAGEEVEIKGETAAKDGVNALTVHEVRKK